MLLFLVIPTLLLQELTALHEDDSQEITREVLGRNIPMCSLYNAKKDRVIKRRGSNPGPAHSKLPQNKLPGNELLMRTEINSSFIPLSVNQRHLNASDSIMLSFIAGYINGLSKIGNLLYENEKSMKHSNFAYTTLITIGSAEEILVNGTCSPPDQIRKGNKATHLVTAISYGVRATFVCRTNASIHLFESEAHSRRANVGEQTATGPTLSFDSEETCEYFGDSHDRIIHSLSSTRKILSYTRVKSEAVLIPVTPLRVHLTSISTKHPGYIESAPDVAREAIRLYDEFKAISEAAVLMQQQFLEPGLDDVNNATVAILPFVFSLPKQLDWIWRDLVYDALHNGLYDLRTHSSEETSTSLTWTRHYDEKLRNIFATTNKLLEISKRLMTEQMQIAESKVIHRLTGHARVHKGDTIVTVIGASENVNALIDPERRSAETSPMEVSLISENPVIILSLNIHDGGLIGSFDCFRDYSRLPACIKSTHYFETFSNADEDIIGNIGQFLEYAEKFNACRLVSALPDETFAVYFITHPRILNETVANVEKWKDGNNLGSANPSSIICNVVSTSTLVAEKKIDSGLRKLSFNLHISDILVKYVNAIDIFLHLDDHAAVHMTSPRSDDSVFVLKKSELEAETANSSAFVFRIQATEQDGTVREENVVTFYCPRYFESNTATCRANTPDPTWETCKFPSCTNETCLKRMLHLPDAEELSTPDPNEQIAFVSAEVIATYNEVGPDEAYFAFYENCDTRQLTSAFLIQKISVRELKDRFNHPWNVSHCGYWNTDVYVTQSRTFCLICRGIHEPHAHCLSLENPGQAVEWSLHDTVRQDATDKKFTIPGALDPHGEVKSFCYFSAPARPHLAYIYTTCTHCREMRFASNGVNVSAGYLCFSGEIQAQDNAMERDDKASFVWKNASRNESQQYERLKPEHQKDRLFSRGFLAGDNAGLGISSKSWHRPQRSLFGRILAATPNGSLVFAARQFYNDNLQTISLEESQTANEGWLQPTCTPSCMRSIPFYEAKGEAHDPAKISYRQEVLENVSFAISADAYYQAAERSVAVDELGNMVFVVIGMYTELQPNGCNPAFHNEEAICKTCDVGYWFEVYLRRALDKHTTNLTEHFKYQFQKRPCGQEFSRESSFLQVDGRHSLWVNRGYIYLRLGKPVKEHIVLKLRYLNET